MRLFGIGCHLAELITDPRGEADCQSTPRDTQQVIDQFNRSFGNLRHLLESSEPSQIEALIQPLIDRFAETLTDAAAARPEVAHKCESLANDLVELQDAPPSQPPRTPPDPEVPL